MRFTLGILAGVVLSVAGGNFLFAQRDEVTVTGTVRTANGFYPSGPILVRLETISAVVREQLTTDGRFEFAHVPSGHYRVIAHVPGYSDASVTGLAPMETQISIILRESTAPASNGGTVSISDLQAPKAARREFEAAQKIVRKDDCESALKHLGRAL